MNTPSQGTYELPKGWVWTSLGEISYVVRGASPRPAGNPKYFGGTIPWITVGEITKDDDMYLKTVSGFVTEAGKHKSRYIEEGTLLLTNSGATLGVPKIASIAGCINDGSVAMLGPDRVTKKFLYHLLSSKTESLRRINQGAAQPNLNTSIVSAILVPLPPLREQKRISHKIEELFTQLDSAIESLKRVQSQLKRYRQAVLKYAVEGKLTAEWRKKHKGEIEPADQLLKRILAERRAKWEEQELAKMKAKGKVPKDDKWKKKYKEPVAPDTNGLPELPEGWAWARIEQLMTTVTSGSRGWAKYYAEDGASFIRAQDIKTDQLVLDNVAHVNAPQTAEGTRTRVNRSDLLITITGANVTKTALVRHNLDEAYVNQHVALARPVQEELADYLYWFVVCPTHGRRDLEALAYGAGKPGLNLDNIRDLVLPVPPIDEQRQITQEIESQDSVTANVESVLFVSFERMRMLRHTVLHSAFSGNLVPQDPNDEPASVLLQRIKAEREEETQRKRREKKSKKTPTKKRSPKMARQSAKERRPLIQVLRDAGDWITPEVLFRESGNTVETIDDFYDELKKAVEENRIVEKRPNPSEVLLKATGT